MGSAPALSGDQTPSRPQNHLNGRGHSVVVLARGDVLVMGHGKAVNTGEGPEPGGYPGCSSHRMRTQVNVPVDASEKQMG